MSIYDEVVQALLFFATWLLPLALLLIILGLLWRQRRAGQVALLVAGLLLLLTGTAYATGDVSWRIFPALVNGYHYSPNEAPPDPRLVPRPPELFIERQLNALIGQTGPAPLREDSPLTAFTIDAVHIEDWHRVKWLTAVLDTTLTFANGRQEQVAITLPARGGYSFLVPFLGEVNRYAYAWYAPESSLGHLLQTPAPATLLRDDAPPLTLTLADRVDVSGLDGVNPATSFLGASDISADGRLLLDVDLREGQTSVGNALLQYANGEIERLAETHFATRAHFAPDGRSLIYLRAQPARTPQLILRTADGAEENLTSVSWSTHHWVSNTQIAYSTNDGAYLYDLESGQSQFLAPLPRHEMLGQHQFRVAPGGERLAYVDGNGRLWVKEMATGQTQAIGWEIAPMGWHNGLAWREDGQQLLFVTQDNVTLPNQQSLWLWDSASGETRLLVQAGPDFLGQAGTNNVNLGFPCWVDDEMAFIAAYIPSYTGQLHILAVNSDGSGVWDVTPTDGPFPYPELHCANGYLAISTERTAVDLYEMR